MAKNYSRKLAFNNFFRNMNLHVPYLIASILTMTSYFTMLCMLYNPGMDNTPASDSIKLALTIGNGIITVFMVLFMMYFNSFIIKKRKKEFGLYSILGLEKRHIARVIIWENMILYTITIFAGLLLGFVFGKLLFLLLLRICRFSGDSSFVITWQAISQTLVLYVIIFLLTSASNIFQIMRSKTIDLLKSDKYGEKKSRLMIPITVLGIALLGFAYFRANTVPDFISALLEFFFLVILVVIATFLLFTSGSIAFLHLIKKQKGIYYKPNNFIAISGLIYRMKQNAAGLAGICILSTMVLVVLSGCISLYAGSEESTARRMRNDFGIYFKSLSSEEETKLLKQAPVIAEKHDLKVEEMNLTRGYDVALHFTGDGIESFERENTRFYHDYEENTFDAVFMGADQYFVSTGVRLTPEKDECFLYTAEPFDLPEQLNFNGLSFRPAGISTDSTLVHDKYFERSGAMYIVFSDSATAEKAAKQYTSATEICDFRMNYEAAADDGIAFGKEMTELYFLTTVITETDENGNTSTTNHYNVIDEFNSDRQQTFSLYGGLLFLGIFFVILFLTATILIIYFKQVSEGYEDKERFEILQKVGMDSDAVKNTINRQILIVFFLPLATAILHTLMARHIIILALRSFYLYNESLVTLCIISSSVAFAIVYFIVFLTTSKVYFRIVKRY